MIRLSPRESMSIILLGVGIVLLVASFALAYQLYSEYNYSWFQERIGGGDLLEAVSGTMPALVFIVFKVSAIAVMVWTGSVLTSRGVELLKAKG